MNIHFIENGYRAKTKIPKRLGEALFVLSYVFFIVYFFKLFKAYIFRDDALHVSLALQWIGHLLGGKELGGKFWIRLFDSLGKRTVATTYSIWAFIWASVGILKYWGMYPKVLDLGIFTQSIWNFSRGRGFQTSIAPDGTTSFLADHQVYTLSLFSPLYWTPFGTELLIIVQSLLLFSPAVFLFVLIEKNWTPTLGLKQSRRWAWLIFFSWMFFSPLVHNTFWDFHLTALLVPTLALWTWSLVHGNLRVFVLTSIFASLTKEHIPFLLLPGIFIYPFRHWYRPLATGLDPDSSLQRKRKYLAWMACSLTVVFIFVFNRAFVGHSDANYFRYYDHLGEDTQGLLISLVTNPIPAVQLLLEWPRLHFLLAIVTPLLFAPFFGGWMTVAWLPMFLCHALSSREQQHSSHFHYILEIWPVASVVATMVWFRWLIRFRRYRNLIAALLLSLIIWHMPNNFYAHGRYFFNRAVPCFPVRAEIRKEIQKIQTRCQDKAIGVAGLNLFPQISDLAWIHPSKKMNAYKDGQAAFSETFNQELGQTGCRFLLLSEQEEADVFRKLNDLNANSYRRQKEWASCFPESKIRLWVGE